MIIKSKIQVTSLTLCRSIVKRFRIWAMMEKIIFGLVSLMLIAFFSVQAGAFEVQKSNNKYQHWLPGDMPISYTIYRGPGDELPAEWIPAITASFEIVGASGSISRNRLVPPQRLIALLIKCLPFTVINGRSHT